MPKLSESRVLIVNDDGIHAPGIALLEKLVRQRTDDVWVVAPDEERSGASNAVSMHTPVRVRQIDERHFAVKGTPTDSVLMALREVMPAPPTLVLSGINRGANLAEDVLYSGTVAAATEAALMGIPSIALSQVFEKGSGVRWDTSERYVLPVVEQILATGLPPSTFVNINFPAVAPDKVAGIRAVRQGRRPPGGFKTEARLDGRDIPYYWIKLVYEPGGYEEGTDLGAIRDGAVSVCPVDVDRTNLDYLRTLSASLTPR